jgi:hypothetical protein
MRFGGGTAPSHCRLGGAGWLRARPLLLESLGRLACGSPKPQLLVGGVAQASGLSNAVAIAQMARGRAAAGSPPAGTSGSIRDLWG